MTKLLSALKTISELEIETKCYETEQISPQNQVKSQQTKLSTKTPRRRRRRKIKT